ncbi:Chemoreceptor glutamine deamidase CheD [Bacillus sp. THAF10]|uniref:chemotaxis protein CheD n=1 Tax=Bacillus sp. THAF10 TaxID=2587848 RepID=UPI00126960B0|nr:chemotaxis protein CheD [Bacillus sp. THAF10]QFT88890.1 Chemoreceptor glutamine deamidase CheD [Bacillus sp. THAF10]
MLEMGTVVKVGIAECEVIKEPQLIRTSGLGSCVGVVIYDNTVKIAGMVHVMLPDSKLARMSSFNQYKYADTGVVQLVQKLIRTGTKMTSLRAKIAGGAQMFQFKGASNDLMRIGPRNVEAVKTKLAELQIPLLSEDCGGNNGRTIEFNPDSGVLMIKTVNKGISYI